MKELKNLTSEYVQLKLNQYEEIVICLKAFLNIVILKRLKKLLN